MVVGVVTFSFRMRHLNLLYCRGEEARLEFCYLLYVPSCFHFGYVNDFRYLEHFQQSFLLNLQPLKWLLLLDNFLAQVLQTWEVIARYAPVQNVK